jgi:hypothetical protein
MTPDEFIDALSVHFPPRHDDPAMASRWLEDMTRGLRHYSSQTLAEAVEEIIRERRLRSFPLLGECRDVCGRHEERVLRVERLRREREALARERGPEIAAGPADPEMGSRVQAMVDELKTYLAAGKLPQADRAQWRDVSRSAFGEMQQESPNPRLHMERG